MHHRLPPRDCSAREDILACVVEALPRLHSGIYKVAALQQAAHDWDTLLAPANPLAASGKLEKLALLTATHLKSKLNKNKAPCKHHDFFEAADHLLAERAALDAQLSLARLRLIRRLVTEGPDQLRQAKRERRVVGFDDMLFNLHDRLTGAGGPALAQVLRQRFPAALIDEYQDTDPLQFSIFNTVYGDGEALLFLVGDPKQAIYSFRNADLHTYLQARRIAQAEYTLVHNQRSVKPMLDALNALFVGNPQAFMLEGLAYHPVDAGDKKRPVLADRSAGRAPLQLWTLPDVAGARPGK